jgi:hypothetical protein
MIQLDGYGLRYVDELPGNAIRINSGWEFVVINPQAFNYHEIKRGKRFALWSNKLKRYEIYEVNDYLSESQIAHYIKQGRLFWLSS